MGTTAREQRKRSLIETVRSKISEEDRARSGSTDRDAGTEPAKPSGAGKKGGK